MSKIKKSLIKVKSKIFKDANIFIFLGQLRVATHSDKKRLSDQKLASQPEIMGYTYKMIKNILF